MKCQIPFSGKNKKSAINLSSAEFSLGVVKVKHGNIQFYRALQSLQNTALKHGRTHS